MIEPKNQDKKLEFIDLKQFVEENPNFRLVVVTSHPRSDMGKGHLSLSLSEVIKDSHIMKYDGIVNLSIEDKYIFDPNESDDFIIYRKNKSLNFSTSNALMLGDILF
jgi:hypothetical protein